LKLYKTCSKKIAPPLKKRLKVFKKIKALTKAIQSFSFKKQGKAVNEIWKDCFLSRFFQTETKRLQKPVNLWIIGA
jgi:uncharacterized protein YpbB